MRSQTAECIEFLQKLVRTRSLPGQEAKIAELVKAEMKRLRFSKVIRDEAGNIIGLCEGEGRAPAMMFNAHLDHVDIGDEETWPHPPFAAEISGERIWGRGTVDIKGPLAAQVHAVGKMIADGIRPPGDIYVSAVVQEETGGLGARHLITHLRPPLVVVGEPSRCQLRHGHRGRSELILHVKGYSVHASVPERAVNPLEVVARFVVALKDLEMRSDGDLGMSSVAPTLVRTDQESPNVTPAEVWLTCDCRTVAGETGEDLQEKLQTLVEQCLIDGASAKVMFATGEQKTYTGMKRTIPAEHPSLLIPVEHRAVSTAVTTLEISIGLKEKPEVWRFATDGGHFAKAGQLVIGFGPGEESLAHTINESIQISDLEKALAGNRALALEWPLLNK